MPAHGRHVRRDIGPERVAKWSPSPLAMGIPGAWHLMAAQPPACQHAYVLYAGRMHGMHDPVGH